MDAITIGSNIVYLLIFEQVLFVATIIYLSARLDQLAKQKDENINRSRNDISEIP